MAFNPFHTFRRHQKKLFAALTILCMFIFVLSSGMGRGDWLTRFGDWLGSSGGKASAAATLYGQNIDHATFAQTQSHRLLANRYMEMATELAHNKIVGNLFSKRDSLDPGLKQSLDMMNYIQAGMQMFGPQQAANGYRRLIQELSTVRNNIDLGSAPNKADQIRLAEQLQLMLQQKIEQINRYSGQQRDSYFGGDIRSGDDTLNFLIWKRKADELGITFSTDDINMAIRAETLESFSEDAAAYVDQHLRNEYRAFFSPDALNQALVDEFRVRAAQAAVAGVSPIYRTHTAPPLAATPAEAFDWFKDNRTLIRVGLIELPTASFLDKVTAAPDEAALKELYAKHKNDDANPALERPGFKDPRRVRIEWIAMPESSPFHRRVAAAALALDPLGSVARISEQYDKYLTNLPSWASWLGFGLRSGLHDSSVLRPETFASAVGASIAGGATGAGPFAGPLVAEGTAITREIGDRARIGASAILDGSAPTVLGLDAMPMAVTPKALTHAQLRPMLLDRVQDDMVKFLADSDRTKFQTDLMKKSKEGADQKAMDAMVAEFVASRQCKTGRTTEARDRFSLANDPGLAPVRAAYQRVRQFRGTSDPTGVEFGGELADGPFDRNNSKPAKYVAQSLTPPDNFFIFWRTEDTDAKVLPFEQARPQVVAAWKLAKARELAKAEAERIMAEAKGLDEQRLRDLAAKSGSRLLIELPPMARLNQQLAFATGGQANYDFPSIPRDRVAYPGAMTNKLMDLRKEPVGGAAVVCDEPKSAYYVAALMGKDVPTAEQFRMVYRNSMAPSVVRDPLMEYFKSERRSQFVAGMLDQLRKEAGAKVLENKQKAEDDAG